MWGWVRGRGRDSREDNGRGKSRDWEKERVQPALQWPNDRVGCCLEVVISLSSEAAENHTSAPSLTKLQRTDCTSKSLLFCFFLQSFILVTVENLLSIQAIIRREILHWISNFSLKQSESCTYSGKFQEVLWSKSKSSLKLIESSCSRYHVKESLKSIKTTFQRLVKGLAALQNKVSHAPFLGYFRG